MRIQAMGKTMLALLILCAVLASACKSQPNTIYGSVSGRVTYARSADKPLTDKANVGRPATDVKVRISLLEQPKHSGGQPVFIQGEPLFELVPDTEGKYQAQLPYGQYLLEIVHGDSAILAKRMLIIKAGQTITADFNVPAP